MSQGRGSAGASTTINNVLQVVLLVCLMLHFEHVRAADHTVGDSGGWTFNLETWPNKKQFRAGDVLIFNYNPTFHNVVGVDRGGYSNCKTPNGAKVYKSGKDRIRLGRGQNYFICSFAGHCESGMKIAVNAV